eukprot:TRINITY_DN10729_c0_g3_i1.p1 TRINITY_DN10729_c0_g3~~TRINITY_DN10729_c0_g3_i1.p1  ORF type:complete len:804 (-),score=126.43 TRINITY_DN10729_c0_g3_i1:433-2844(-)
MGQHCTCLAWPRPRAAVTPSFEGHAGLEDEEKEQGKQFAETSAVGQGVGIFFDELMTLHRSIEHPQHPEQPARITQIFKRLEDEGLVQRCVRLPCRAATKDELELKHTARHVEAMLQIPGLSEGEAIKEGHKYNSVFLSPDSCQAALLSAGSVLEATSRVCRGEVASAVCVVRPPGHHAECDCAMGFCLFGNVALAAEQARRNGWSERVLIVDWDVHHGNGTQNMFDEDSSVLYFSTHRYDGGSFYPGGKLGHYTSHGKGAGQGFSVNVPFDVKGGMRRGCEPPADAELLDAFQKLLLPICEEFQPDLILISAGFDAAAGDPLGGCGVTPAGYFELTRLLGQIPSAKGRIVLALEGGYNLESISSSMAACTRALLGDLGPGGEAATAIGPAQAFHADCVEEAREHLSQFWPPLNRLADPARVPKCALEGGWLAMQLQLKNHAEATGGDLAVLRQRHEALCFKLEDIPPAPQPLGGAGRIRALHRSFTDSLGKGEEERRPWLVVILHLETPQQAVIRAGQAFAAGAHGLWIVNSGHAHSPAEAAGGPQPGVQVGEFKPQAKSGLRKPPPRADSAKETGNAQLRALAECFAAVRAKFPGRWLGVVIPQLPNEQVFAWIAANCASADGLWIHRLELSPASLDWDGGRALRLLRWHSVHEQSTLSSLRRARQAGGWLGQVFGSVAVRDQQLVHHDQEQDATGEACHALLSHCAQLAASVCDAIVTSAASPEAEIAKLRAMAPARPLALQNSSLSPEGSSPMPDLLFADAAVGVGLPGQERNLLDFDEAKLQQWVASWSRATTLQAQG